MLYWNNGDDRLYTQLNSRISNHKEAYTLIAWYPLAWGDLEKDRKAPPRLMLTVLQLEVTICMLFHLHCVF